MSQIDFESLQNGGAVSVVFPRAMDWDVFFGKWNLVFTLQTTEWIRMG
jgi:putative heme degradation protein